MVPINNFCFQITFLHVSHHTMMPIVSWAVLRYQPGGHASFGALLNAIVHTCMYSYYFLSALGPWVRPYLWWKPYITLIQIAQFVIGMIHQAQLLFQEDDCGYPKESCYLVFPFGFYFFVMFSNFYVKAYMSEKDEVAKKLKWKSWHDAGNKPMCDMCSQFWGWSISRELRKKWSLTSSYFIPLTNDFSASGMERIERNQRMEPHRALFTRRIKHACTLGVTASSTQNSLSKMFHGQPFRQVHAH